MRSLLVVLIALMVAGCGDTIINLPTDPTPLKSTTTTTTTTPVPVKHTIQFRVLGNATSARVRYSTPVDGLGQVITSLPFFDTFTISGDSLFLSLEASPISYGYGILYPFLAIQIVVDGTVFREATTQDFLLAPLSTSGQWRQ
jgi:hypothetical protein